MAIKNYRVGNTTFNPYTYEELLRVPQQLTEYHNKLEAENNELMNKAELLNYYISQNPNSKSASMYNKFKDIYTKAADDLAHNGLHNGVARQNALDLRNSYRTMITPIAEGIERMLAAKKNATADNIGSLGTLDDYVLDPTYTPKYLSAQDIVKAMKDTTESLSKTIAPRYLGTSEDEQYKRYFYGVHPSDVKTAYAYIQNPDYTYKDKEGNIHKLANEVNHDIVDQIINARNSYGYDNMSNMDKMKINYAMQEGIRQGLGTIKSERNYDHITPAQWHNWNNNDGGGSSSSSGGGLSDSMWMKPDEDIVMPPELKEKVDKGEINANSLRIRITGDGVYRWAYPGTNGEWITTNQYNSRGELYGTNKTTTLDNTGYVAWTIDDGKLSDQKYSANYIETHGKQVDVSEVRRSKQDDIGPLVNAINNPANKLSERNGKYYKYKGDYYFVPNPPSKFNYGTNEQQSTTEQQQSNFNPIIDAK